VTYNRAQRRDLQRMAGQALDLSQLRPQAQHQLTPVDPVADASRKATPEARAQVAAWVRNQSAAAFWQANGAALRGDERKRRIAERAHIDLKAKADLIESGQMA
jgi:hypothetical protein